MPNLWGGLWDIFFPYFFKIILTFYVFHLGERCYSKKNRRYWLLEQGGGQRKAVVLRFGNLNNPHVQKKKYDYEMRMWSMMMIMMGGLL